MKPTSAQVLGGAYHFTQNLLFAVVADLLTQPDGDQRVRAMLETLDRLNMKIEPPEIRKIAEDAVAAAYAAMIASNRQ